MAEVNVRKRGTKWEYRFEVASISGQRKQKSKGGFRTKAEALKAGREALVDYENTGIVNTTNSEISYSDFLQAWYDEYVLPNLKPSSTRNYKTAINKHITPAIGNYRLSSITHSTLQNFINSKADDGLCKSTIHIILAVIKGSFKYAYKKKSLIKTNPALEIVVPKNAVKGKRDVRAYSEEEIANFFSLLQGTDSYYAAMIAYHTGMRIGEIAALTWDDIDFMNQVIHVNKTLTVATHGLAVGAPKSESSVRDIVIGDTLIHMLRQLQTKNLQNEAYYDEYYTRIYADNNGKLYTSAGDDKELYEMKFIMRHENGKLLTTKDIHLEIKEKTDGKLKFHNLRHTHATILVGYGVPIKTVQDRLGHADVSVTLNKYVDVTNDMRSTAVHAIENAWTNGGQNNRLLDTKR